ncbi:MAG: hypothetical protein Q9208_001429 [Pyrenodesmia sp. 3 TL-2023]
MAEIFSTIAGVASVIDVALRGCNVLYSSIHYLKETPQLSLRLRQTVQSVESILRCLDEFVAVYRRQQPSAGSPGCLPDAVSHGVVLIKAELDALSTLLPAPSASGQIRQRLKWVLDQKRVIEVVQRLDSHQITLTLALQSFAQRNDIKVEEQLSQRLAKFERQHEDTAQELKGKLDSVSTGLHSELSNVAQAFGSIQPAQERLGAGLNDLHGLISAGQGAASDKLDDIRLSLSQMRVGNNQVRSSTVLIAPTEDVLARMFRAELGRVIMPTVRKCFDTFKANPDRQLDEIRRKIDDMAQRLGSKSDEDRQENVKPSCDPSRAAGSRLTHHHQDLTDSTVLYTPDMTAFGVARRQDKVHGRRIKHWRCSWRFHWTIGTLCVTVSTTITNRKTSPEYRIGVIPSPQKAYRVTIEFLPAQSLVQLRGLTLSVANTQDQRGYSQICPFLSTFAVVPWGAEIIEYSKTNNVEGIQYLFERGLAAPSDRDEHGFTPFMWAAYGGAFEACQLLLDEGSDPLAIDKKEVWSHNTLEVATALLKNGADPYALNRYGKSLFDGAEDYGQTSILLEALERAGYEINEVQEEIEWRQWCFDNPGHGFAESTAVDGAQIAPPSTEGLVLRKSVHGDRLEE